MKQLQNNIKNTENELNTYLSLLNKWQKAVNLVSKSTLSDAWNRHILDSAQLYPYLTSSSKVVVDFGSGAGFPALVLAILNQKNNGPVQIFYLIESDLKKSLFLKEVVRVLNLPVQVINQRIEKVSDIHADVITARALTDLNQLLKLSVPFIQKESVCLFLKGKTADDEIKKCSIPCQIQKIKSITDSDGCVLKITEVKND